MTINFHSATPILYAQDLAASLDYYQKVLGFQLDWHDPGVMASVSRGDCHLMLTSSDQGHPGSWVWIGVGDADALHDEYRAHGAKIRHPPTNYAWAYELQIEDLDCNVLRFGAEPKPDQPYGPWLDSRGQTWLPQPQGGWVKVP
ncbi:hypothetical protein GCM10027275_54330 [Rhabdobacter roseus]|uniref:Catechol 2,3-dioxygenase-like lactoylglutathione lyase family enzyme n=1 Tax=Rhabdobacter roseus TaxID=1655419 RepID=A0A840U122_9BACT|nr:VOC family protein [Rhabdobacter roseus]MBB5287447.1 catechol 2,3-dioxygenase-like lactoylglutathione lyase family enzyme [Rhabdobacter roseus]